MTSRTILVIEDHEDSRLLVRTALEHQGYRVLEAENGLDGLRLAREYVPDLVVTDLQMPVMDGWQAARELRADPRTRGIPVVATTAHQLAPAGRVGYERLFRAVLLKPLALSDLLLVVKGFVETR